MREKTPGNTEASINVIFFVRRQQIKKATAMSEETTIKTAAMGRSAV